MDFLISTMGSFLAEIGRGMCTSTYSRATYTIRFKSNIKALKHAVNGLIEVQKKVNKDIKTLEIKRKSLNVQLRRWLRDVEEIVSEANSIQERRVSCALSLKCRISKKVVVILEDVKRLEKEGIELLDIFSVESKSELVEKILGPSIPETTRASEMLVKVLRCLMNDEVQKIGVWGMGGVGKTTLVRELNNKLWKEAETQSFGKVIWATVSKEFELRSVQKQIAERLDIEIKLGETEEKLARRIHGKLEKVSSFLLILDDVWKPIDLDQLGIPDKGSKIVLTSRFLEVCRSMRTDIDFRVDCLSEEEAWDLFCQNAGEVTRSDHVRSIARKVSKECGGLPLAIITVGMAMRGKKMVKLWKHALKELKSSVPYVKSIEEKIYQPLKLSYDLLQDKMKSCLLFCALFPEDYSIEVAELVRYWIAEDFIDDKQNHSYLMNQGVSIVEDLKDSCLLEEGACDGTVKMHDVVRDFAIWIMSSSQDDSHSHSHSLVMSGIGLREIRQEKFVPSIRRISLMSNKLESLPEPVVKCVELSTLLLQGNFNLKELPPDFLLAFPALRILNLGGTCISSLPDSIGELHDLRSLILKDCYYLEKVPSLEGLTKLQILDLCATRIKESPKGLKNSLRLLNLSRTHHLESIPAGTIQQISNLEVLDMTLSHFHWGVQGQTQEGQATLEEIACLTRLSILSIRVVCIPEYNHWIERLKKFQFFIGPTANSLPSRHDKRRVTISSLNVSEAFIGWLLENATSLVMNHCWGLKEMLENLVIDSTSSFNSLKSLTVEGFGGSIRPAGGCAAQLDLIPNLEELNLRRVNLETIRELVGHLGLRFETLKHIEVSHCTRLKCLLSLGNFICFLPNLQEIHVSFCDMLQELFEYSPAVTEPVVPALRVIKLRNLPRLKRLCSQEESWGSLEYVEVIRCNRLKNLPIRLSNAEKVKEVRGETNWWNNLTWDDNTTREILQSRFVAADGNLPSGSLGF